MDDKYEFNNDEKIEEPIVEEILPTHEESWVEPEE